MIKSLIMARKAKRLKQGTAALRNTLKASNELQSSIAKKPKSKLISLENNNIDNVSRNIIPH